MKKEEIYFVKCTKTGEKAQIIVSSLGHKNPQDIEPTYRHYGARCCLHSNGSCVLIDFPCLFQSYGIKL